MSSKRAGGRPSLRARASMIGIAVAVASLGACRAESEPDLPKACDDYLATVRRCGGGESPDVVKRRLAGETDPQALAARCANAARALGPFCR